MASLVFLSAEVRADWGKPEPSPFIHLVIQQIVPEGLPCTPLSPASPPHLVHVHGSYI